MAATLVSASRLKPDIRIAQAVSLFEASLTSDERAVFTRQRAQLQASPPDQRDVMQLVAEFNNATKLVPGGRPLGTRLNYFLDAVQHYAAAGDILLGGSQNTIGCSIWLLVRMTVLSITTHAALLDNLSAILMSLGQSAPRHEAIALLIPRSRRLQTCLTEYFATLVDYCHSTWKFAHKYVVQKGGSTLIDTRSRGTFNELNNWAESIKDEIDLLVGPKTTGINSLVSKSYGYSKRQRRLAKRLRILSLCSTYDYQRPWRRTRKLGNSSLCSRDVEYQKWKDQRSSSALVYLGKLAAGKSVLMASIVDDLNLWDKSKSVSYFFCRYDLPESLKTRTIIGCLIQQVLSSLEDFDLADGLPDETTTSIDIEALLRILQRVFPKTRTAYFVLDGLDESNATTVDEVLQILQRLQEIINLKVCISIRHNATTPQSLSLKGLPAAKLVVMDNKPDIEAYIDAELARRVESGKLKLSNSALRLEIQQKLPSGSQGVFLWVALQLELLGELRTDDAIREALNTLPKDLSGTFSYILHHAAQRPGRGARYYQKRILELAAAFYRPLTTEQLREALNVVPGDTEWQASGVVDDVMPILPYCGALVVIDEEDETVRLVHPSFQHFLQRGFTYPDGDVFSMDLAHQTAVAIIVTYLNYGVFDTRTSTGGSPTIPTKSTVTKTLPIAVDSGSSRNIAFKLLKIKKQPDLDTNKTAADTRKDVTPQSIEKFHFFEYAKQHCISHVLRTSDVERLFISLFVSLLSKRIIRADTTPDQYHSLLLWAAARQHDGIVRLLVEMGKSELQTKSSDGSTTLIIVASYGYDVLVRLLLETGKADVEAQTTTGSTALMCAADQGHDAVVKLLAIQGRANLEARDRNGWTALMFAASQGHDTVVRLLLETGDVDVEARNKAGWTALSCAADKGRENVAKMLLKIGRANLEARTNQGWTPLTIAADRGHLAVVRMLIVMGNANVEARTNDGWTPLMCAADEGHTGVVQMLLELGEADVDAQAKDGSTALICAASAGHEEVVRVLVQMGKADVEIKDGEGMNALGYADRWEGPEGIVRVLQEVTRSKMPRTGP